VDRVITWGAREVVKVGVAVASKALERARAFHPDVAVVDVVMPGVGGLELAPRLLGVPGLERLAVVVLTGHTSEDRLDGAYRAGARHYLVKPADPVLLRGLLGSLRRDGPTPDTGRT
jgi:CheY-like chemotaxis protein